ncbi:MAG TPA: TonB-dependent receptor [Bacteroidota bacterium]|nr:TonB-dependent receptor [Bacteroidota bacterium]
MRLPTIMLLLALPWHGALSAGGSIAGRVTGKGDGEPLVGATVLLEGTVRGTTTNTKGDYRIAGITPGRYTVVFSMVGYQHEKRADVAVEEGKETALNVAMVQTPVQTEQIVVTASRREQSLQEVPVSIAVLEATELQMRNAQTIDDALRYVPGVNITGGQVNIRGSSGYSRGAGSRVLMLLDGVPFIAGDTGELVFESIPVGQIERIEVVKGASSALYGSSALGGVINIITKQIPETPETDVRTYAGLYNKPSFGSWAWSQKNRYYNGESVSHAYKSGDLGVALFFSRQFDDGYRQNDYHRRYNVFVKTKEDFAGSSSLTMNFGLLYQYGGQYLYWRNLDSALIPPSLQQTDDVRSIRYYANALYNGVLSDNALFTAKFLWYHNDWGYETIHAIGMTKSLSDEIGVEATTTLVLDRENTMTAGFTGTFDEVNADLFGQHSGGGLAAYAQDEYRVAAGLIATAGVRFDFETVGIIKPSGQVNPKAALSYTPVEGTTLRASYGRGFRVPSVAEAFIQGEVSNLATLPNKNLQPERSSSYEVGIAQTVWGAGTVDIAAFRSDFDNLIEPGLFAPAGSNLPYIQWTNVTQARVQGIDASFRFGLFDGGLGCNVGYTYADPEDLVTHEILRYRPRHLFYANLAGRVGMFTAGADFRYVSRVDNIDIELVNLGIIPDGDQRGDILVTDVRAGADFAFTGLPLSATLQVNNLLQRNYVELTGNIMPPRTYVLVLEAKF